MSNDLRLYDVTVGGHTTLMRLNDRDAKAYGINAVLAVEQILAGPVLKPTLAEPLPDNPPADESDPANVPAADSKARSAIPNKMRGTDVRTRPGSPMNVGRSTIITETE